MKYMFSQFNFENKKKKSSIFHNPVKYNHIQNTAPKYKNDVHINKKAKTIDCSTFIQTNDNPYWNETFHHLHLFFATSH